MNDLSPYIQAYIKNLDEIREKEDYKWTALVEFKKNFRLHGLSLDVVKYSFAKHKNLLDAGFYFPLGMLKKVVTYRPKETEKMLARLFDEKRDLRERIEEYMGNFDEEVRLIAKNEFKEWGENKVQTYQDTHAISVYLFFRHPGKHYIYKSSLFDSFATIVGYHIKSNDKIGKYIEFENLCDQVKSELLKEEDLVEDYNRWLELKNFVDPMYNLLTQDFIYAVAIYLNEEITAIEATTDFVDIESKTFSQHKALSFAGTKGVDYEKRDKLCRNLGTKGELWVMNYEKRRLRKDGIKGAVKYTARDEGDGLGYDIESVESDGVTPRYIEVKTTTGPLDTPFFFTSNELDFSELHAEHYYLYRVYDYDEEEKYANVGIAKGSLSQLRGIPDKYKAIVKEKKK